MHSGQTGRPQRAQDTPVSRSGCRWHRGSPAPWPSTGVGRTGSSGSIGAVPPQRNGPGAAAAWNGAPPGPSRLLRAAARGAAPRGGKGPNQPRETTTDSITTSWTGRS